MLSGRFGRTKIFRATRSIAPGEEFDPAIMANLRHAQVVLAMIGRDWSTATDSNGRRLDDPADWVRRELLEARTHRIPVIPVLDRDNRLSAAELPEVLHWLADLQSVRIRSASWDIDKRLLFEAIERHAPALRRSSPSPAPRPALPELDQPWAPGVEVTAGGHAFVVHTAVQEITGRDGSWVWRDADADQFEPGLAPVVLRQVRLRRAGPEVQHRLAALDQEARLLGDRRVTAPRLLSVLREPSATTLVLARPHQRTLLDSYPPGRPLDPWRTTGFLTTLARCCAAVRELHELGYAHRALAPEKFLLSDNGQRVALRDPGLATVPWSANEGHPHYRAPEQHYLAEQAADQPRVDVYQLAALAYHVLTGHPPSVYPEPPPASHLATGLTSAVDQPLGQALSGEPAKRQPSAAGLGRQLATAAARLGRLA